MTKFRLKVKGETIKIYRNNEFLGESEDFKEVLTFISQLIIQERIKKYKIYVLEKGKTRQLTNVNPEAIIKDNPNIEFEDDDDDDFDDDDDDISVRGKVPRSERTRKVFNYTSRYSFEDYVNLGQRIADELSSI